MKVPSVIVPNANIFIVGEAPGREEDATGKPFVGASGKLLTSSLSRVGLSRFECSISNIALERPPANNISLYYKDKYNKEPKPILSAWIESLRQELLTYRPNIVIALGRHAAFTLCGEIASSIEDVRGYPLESTLIPGLKVLPTYHPAAVLRDWNLHYTFLWDLQKAKRLSSSSSIIEDNRIAATSLSVKSYLEFLDSLIEQQAAIAFDIETTRDIDTPNMLLLKVIGIATSSTYAVSFRLASNSGYLYSKETTFKILQRLALVLKHCPVIMQNGKFDKAVLLHYYNIHIERFAFDTMVAMHVKYPELPRSLKFITSLTTEYPPWKHTSSFDNLDYNAKDCMNTFEAWEVLSNTFTDSDWKTFSFEMEQNDPAIYLELQGLIKDSTKAEALDSTLKNKIAILQDSVNTYFKKEININSPKQLSNLLYIELELPIQYKRRKSISEPKKPTTEKEALSKLQRETSSEILSDILELKRLIKLRQFIQAQLSPSGRVHTCYNITGKNMTQAGKSRPDIEIDEQAKSFGRWSSSKSIIIPYTPGNLQNVPSDARVIYCAPPGYTLLQIDYVQAEAVVVAYISGDAKSSSIFKQSFGLSPLQRKEQKLDMHTHNAATGFGVDYSKVTKDQRKKGKVLKHGVHYDASYKVVMAQLECSAAEAKKFISSFAARFPLVKIWHRSVIEELKSTRTLTNLLGRKHAFLGRLDDRGVHRSAFSYVPQSTVGDLLNKALVEFYKRGIPFNLQLHDAIYLLVPEEDINNKEKLLEWGRTIREIMYIPLSYKGVNFLIDVDFKVGKYWGEMEEIWIPHNESELLQYKKLFS